MFDRPIAHRGLHDADQGIIENSLPAFEAAIQSGFDIECDLQLSGDGVAMVFHDNVLDRLTEHSGPIHVPSARQLGRIPLKGCAETTTIPTFSEMLNLVAGRTKLVIELKHQPTRSMTEALANATLSALQTYKGEYVLESFDPHLLIALRNAGCKAPLGIITERYDPALRRTIRPVDRYILRHLLHYPLTRFSFISADQKALRLPMIRLARSLGLPVSTWTIRSQEEADSAAPHTDQIVFEGYSPV